MLVCVGAMVDGSCVKWSTVRGEASHEVSAGLTEVALSALTPLALKLRLPTICVGPMEVASAAYTKGARQWLTSATTTTALSTAENKGDDATTERIRSCFVIMNEHTPASPIFHEVYCFLLASFDTPRSHAV